MIVGQTQTVLAVQSETLIVILEHRPLEGPGLHVDLVEGSSSTVYTTVDRCPHLLPPHSRELLVFYWTEELLQLSVLTLQVHAVVTW